MTFKNGLIALALPAIASAAPTNVLRSNNDINIINGTAAAAGDFPYIVSLQVNGTHNCGASLLNANTVITAAHCLVDYNATDLQIRAGSLNSSSGGVFVQVSSITPNPAYNATTNFGDVGIFKLATPINETDTIKYAKLPVAGATPAAGTSLTVAGWGDTADSAGAGSPILLEVSVPVVDHKECEQEYAKLNQTVSQDQFCAALPQGGKDSCQGDSGGPIVDPTASSVLLGLVSWGVGCAVAGQPGVYTDVTQQLEFINKNLN